MQPKDTKIKLSIGISVALGYAENVFFDVKAKIVNLPNKKNPAKRFTGFLVIRFDKLTCK